MARELFNKYSRSRQEMPGPGQYDPFIKHNSRWVQKSKKNPPLGGTMERSDFLDRSIQNPGPGSYEIQTEMSSEISYLTKMKMKLSLKSMGKRQKIQEKVSPGPGEYNPEQKRAFKGESYMFKQKSYRAIKNKNNSQLLQLLHNLNQQKAQMIKDPVKKVVQIKSSQRVKDSQNIFRLLRLDQKNQIGPGSYNLNFPDSKPFYLKIKNNAAFISTESWSISRDQLPGPGEYSVDTHASKGIVSCFRSLTERSMKGKVDDRKQCEIIKRERESHLYNLHNRWI